MIETIEVSRPLKCQCNDPQVQKGMQGMDAKVTNPRSKCRFDTMLSLKQYIMRTFVGHDNT